MRILDPLRGATDLLPGGLRDGKAGAAQTPPTAPASFSLTARYRSPILSGRPDRIVVVCKCRSEQSVTPSHAAPAQPNTRDFEVGWQLFPALAATGAGRGGQGVRWSLAYLSALNSFACGLVLGGVHHTANYVTQFFKTLLGWGTVAHSEQSSTGNFRDVGKDWREFGNV